jgi:pantoate--beta-alanine ligase
MLIFKRITDLQLWLATQRAAGKTIGFAPTMGALHVGHLELVRRATAAGDVAVTSIFVNPTQFNDPRDLEKYPRTPGRDIEMLTEAGCEALLMPDVPEMYPPGRDLTLHLDFGPLATVMEGHFRPGHFGGMATVVKRLLDIVQPERIYMGQKDYQQMSIVREMLRLLGSTTDLVMCPTVREADGLAMSSRNTRLSPEMRAVAPVIFQALTEAKERFGAGENAGAVQATALSRLAAAGLRPEYFDLVDGVTLQPIARRSDVQLAVACTAAWADDVRLIDNLML